MIILCGIIVCILSRFDRCSNVFYSLTLLLLCSAFFIYLLLKYLLWLGSL